MSSTSVEDGGLFEVKSGGVLDLILVFGFVVDLGSGGFWLSWIVADEDVRARVERVFLLISVAFLFDEDFELISMEVSLLEPP